MQGALRARVQLFTKIVGTGSTLSPEHFSLIHYKALFYTVMFYVTKYNHVFMTALPPFYMYLYRLCIILYYRLCILDLLVSHIPDSS